MIIGKAILLKLTGISINLDSSESGKGLVWYSTSLIVFFGGDLRYDLKIEFHNLH